MPRSRLSLPPQPLRTWLLAPIIALVLISLGSLSAIEERAVYRQTEELVHQHGDVLLAGITQRLDDLQRAKRIYAQLLAEQPSLPQAVEEDSQVSLTQILVPWKSSLRLGRIEIYNKKGQPLLRLGVDKDSRRSVPLVQTALAGLTRSEIAVSHQGLRVIASTPIKGSQGIVGTLLTDTILDGEALKPDRPEDAIEVALFHNGRLSTTTIHEPAVVNVLQWFKLTANNLETLNHRALAPLFFHASATALSSGDQLLVLTPTQQIVQDANQRKLLKFSVIAGLVMVILLMGLFFTRGIAKPLEAMVAITQDIIRSHYNQRLKSSPIHELNQLSEAINYLAEQVEVQLANLSYQAFHDSLTDLPNRALFEDRLQQAWVRSHRSHTLIAVLFIDLDGFKLINDSFGHKVGDQLLIALSQRLKLCLRSGDTLARLGGDEFTILLENIHNIGDATNVADRVAQQLQASFMLAGHEVFATASIGIAFGIEGCNHPEDFLRNADIAMYEAKKNGKAHHQVFNLAMNDQARQRLRLETELRQAIEHSEFRVYYQPVVQLATSQIVEIEALVRWQHPQRGLVAPAEFIPVAEQTGLIIPIGQWVLEQACQQLRQWQFQYPGHSTLIMNVNLSVKQFQQPQIADVITQTLSAAGLEPHCLKLEITESMVMEKAEATIAVLQNLKDLGIHLAIDDFGIGFSALSYLKQFPVDTLKIDRSFIQGLGHSPQDTAIVHAIIAFAKTLNLSITTEGIETMAQATQLRTLGCDRGQGYYFAKPMTAEAFSALLTSLQPLHSA